jgi:hypothetical protein
MHANHNNTENSLLIKYVCLRSILLIRLRLINLKNPLVKLQLMKELWASMRHYSKADILKEKWIYLFTIIHYYTH